MCLIKFAKKINIFYREVEKITRVDIYATYLFILSFIVVLVFYSKQYYIIIQHDLDKCEKKESHNSCLKTEISYIIVPYIGILYGFFQTFYKVADISSFLINWFCCCKPIDNNNNSNIQIELNKL